MRGEGNDPLPPDSRSEEKDGAMRISLGLGLVLLAAVLFVSPPANASSSQDATAASPQQAIDAYVQDVLRVFQKYGDADLKESAKQREHFKQDLSSVAREVFAYRIMVRMSLGRYWGEFTQKQQEEMIELFVRLIEDNYFGKLMEYMGQVESVSRDIIEITDEIEFSSRKAEVRSVIHYNTKKIPVNYRMILRQQQGWQVYDIHVEHVSLISNYRSQFEDMLNRKSPEEVLATMQRKVEEDETPDVLDSE